MTLEIEDIALERLLNGPAPYGSDRRPHPITAQEDLSAALEGQAPRLSQFVLDRLGPAKTAELAQVIRRAVAVGIRRRAEGELRERLVDVQDLLLSGLDQVTDGCTTPEVETELCVCGKPAEHVNADPDSSDWACRLPRCGDEFMPGTSCGRTRDHSGLHATNEPPRPRLEWPQEHRAKAAGRG